MQYFFLSFKNSPAAGKEDKLEKINLKQKQIYMSNTEGRTACPEPRRNYTHAAVDFSWQGSGDIFCDFGCLRLMKFN